MRKFATLLPAQFLLLTVCALCARAAVVEGVVLDEETGNPLARSQVALVPLPGTQASTTAVRTGARGSFVILSVRPGWYVLRATRRGYVPAESGQLRPGRPGHAFEVADDRASGFLELKMSHLPDIIGTVFDENNVGIPKWQVHVYSANRPVRHVAQTITDDRGNFRIGELDPGSYLVRSGPGNYVDGTPVLATYSKVAAELRDALPVRLRVGEKNPNVEIRPVKGPFLVLSGTFLPIPFAFATLTLITDTGRRDILSGSEPVPMPFTVTGVQPGPVELVVKGTDGFGKECGSYARLAVDKDVANLRLACSPIRPSSVQVSGADLKSPPVFRRIDLDGAGNAHPLARNEALAPGHWEVSVVPGSYYIYAVRNYFGSPSARAGDWWGFDTGTEARLLINLRSPASAISGLVSTHGSPVAGAPIFLMDKTSGQTWTGRSDSQGKYRMDGLNPSGYKIVSGFDLDAEDAAESREASEVATYDGNTSTQALELVLPRP